MGQIRNFLASATIVFAAMPSSTNAEQETELVVGYRAEVPPFSYLAAARPDGRLTSEVESEEAGRVITGFMINVCYSVIQEMKKHNSFRVRFKEIASAQKRFEFLEAGEIHVLCDPATINQERLAIPSVMVSPPVYLSGIGVAEYDGRQWPYFWPCIGSVVGVVQGTTAFGAVKTIAEANGFGPTFSPFVERYLYNDVASPFQLPAEEVPNCNAQAQADSVALQKLDDMATAYAARTAPPVVRDFSDHKSLATALCKGEIYYSVGDLEIIARALSSVKNSGQQDCAASVNSLVFTEERYGIFAHVSKEMTETDRLVLSFLRQLSIEIHKGEDSVLVRSFIDNFKRSEISRSLDVFFWSVVAGSK
ncbi:hypothetical protein [Tropicimonas sp. S265A]|uniref:hypothetical protein n=1 Tax=Tropicimonas sp. S265A TaxID=3415134 RepID=UPI003C799038